MITEHLTLCEAIRAGTPMSVLAKRKDDETVQFIKRQLHTMPLQQKQVKKEQKVFRIGGNRYYITQCSICNVDVFRKVLTKKAVCNSCKYKKHNKQRAYLYKTKKRLL